MHRERVLKKLAIKQRADPSFEAFGARGHHYELNYPIGIEEVEEIEQKYRISLPEDYKKFVAYVGDGGAGPGYGVLPLKSSIKRLGSKRNKEKLAKDFIRPDERQENDEYDTGKFIICEYGCHYDAFLIVTGKERGYIWEIDDDAGILPALKNPPNYPNWCELPRDEYEVQINQYIRKHFKARNHQKMTFSEWYAKWLEDT